jgi:predicted DNA-binding transcriptional regulator AlpA
MARKPRYPTIVEAMSINDIADYTGTKAATVAHFHRQGQGGLPAPHCILAGRPIWERAQIDEWQKRRRPPGRPPTGP